MNKSLLAAGAVFFGVFGVLLGINMVGAQAPETGSPPVQEIVIVNEASELPSPTPNEVPSPTSSPSTVKASFVPPKTNPPNTQNPEAGGGTGGGYAGGKPKVTGTPPTS